MRPLRLAAVAFVVVLPLGLATSAASAEVAHHVAGDYSITVHWTDPVINDTTSMDVAASGSVTFGNGDVGTWTSHHKKFTMFVSSATYLGKKTKTGFSGTMSNTDGNSGTWSAVFS
jgi:hypothetical protein